jgi:hypothetical protein
MLFSNIESLFNSNYNFFKKNSTKYALQNTYMHNYNFYNDLKTLSDHIILGKTKNIEQKYIVLSIFFIKTNLYL